MGDSQRVPLSPPSQPEELRSKFLNGSYDFGGVEFSHGGGTVSGIFVGNVEERGDMLAIYGETTVWFADEFVDPLRIGVEPGDIPYPITGNWRASFSAEVFKDEGLSDFVDDGAR